MESRHASQIVDAIRELAAAQARYEITAEKLRLEIKGIGYQIRPTTTEIEVAKERLNYLLQETP